MTDLQRTIEAVLFVSDAPVTEAELSELTDTPPGDVRDALASIRDHWGTGHGVHLHEVAGGWRFATDPELHDTLERYASTDRARRLSKAALETLAIIAYQQPISRGQVSEIRGVDSEQTIRNLERRDLVAEIGRAPGPGQAVLYGTTPTFLERKRHGRQFRISVAQTVTQQRGGGGLRQPCLLFLGQGLLRLVQFTAQGGDPVLRFGVSRPEISDESIQRLAPGRGEAGGFGLRVDFLPG